MVFPVARQSRSRREPRCCRPASDATRTCHASRRIRASVIGVALHVAALAGGEVRGVEGQRIALRKLRVLPLVIRGKSANPLVVVERSAADSPCGMPRKTPACCRCPASPPWNAGRGWRSISASGTIAWNAVALFIHHHGRHAHHEAAIAQLVRTLWMEWQVVQVSPSRSNDRSIVALGLSVLRPERRSGYGNCRNAARTRCPWSRIRMFTLVR